MSKILRFIRRNGDLIYSFVPAAIFLIVYHSVSYKAAITVGFIVAILTYAGIYIFRKSFSALNYLGMISLLIGTVVRYVSNDPATYLYYPIVTNAIYATLLLGSYFVDRDVISILAKGYYESEVIYDQCKPALRRLTLLWGTVYCLRLIIKILIMNIGNFNLIFWINWALGYPITVALIFITFSYPDKYYFKYVYPNLPEDERPIFRSKEV